MRVSILLARSLSSGREIRFVSLEKVSSPLTRDSVVRCIILILNNAALMDIASASGVLCNRSVGSLPIAVFLLSFVAAI